MSGKRLVGSFVVGLRQGILPFMPAFRLALLALPAALALSLAGAGMMVVASIRGWLLMISFGLPPGLPPNRPVFPAASVA